MKVRRLTYFVIGLVVLIFLSIRIANKINLNNDYVVGQPIDSLNGVVVYYNGGVDHIAERNTTHDGYNLGLKYQCVEFVKRYYYEHLNHKMPDAYGHAKDFYDTNLTDGELNTKRNLIQYTNGSKSKPKPDDLIIFAGSTFNKYGHVAIISSVDEYDIEIIQQNPGPFGKARVRIKLSNIDGLWRLSSDKLLGWLRKE